MGDCNWWSPSQLFATWTVRRVQWHNSFVLLLAKSLLWRARAYHKWDQCRNWELKRYVVTHLSLLHWSSLEDTKLVARTDKPDLNLSPTESSKVICCPPPRENVPAGQGSQFRLFLSTASPEGHTESSEKVMLVERWETRKHSLHGTALGSETDSSLHDVSVFGTSISHWYFLAASHSETMILVSSYNEQNLHFCLVHCVRAEADDGNRWLTQVSFDNTVEIIRWPTIISRGIPLNTRMIWKKNDHRWLLRIRTERQINAFAKKQRKRMWKNHKIDGKQPYPSRHQYSLHYPDKHQFVTPLATDQNHWTILVSG